jgi:hypothetical protein
MLQSAPSVLLGGWKKCEVGAFTAADQAGNYSNNSSFSAHHGEFHAVMPML